MNRTRLILAVFLLSSCAELPPAAVEPEPNTATLVIEWTVNGSRECSPSEWAQLITIELVGLPGEIEVIADCWDHSLSMEIVDGLFEVSASLPGIYGGVLRASSTVPPYLMGDTVTVSLDLAL